MTFQEKIYSLVPDFFQNAFITAYNFKSYRRRHGKEYWQFRKEFSRNDLLSKAQLENLQLEKAKAFLKHAKENSPYYSKTLDKKLVDNFSVISDIANFPLVSKEALRKNINEVVTVPRSKAIVAKTGGTTGVSLEVLFTKEDIEARCAFVDNVRHSFGYKLGKKTAWFSGKKLLSQADLRKGRFWKTDYIHGVRYYSTFHIQQNNLQYYLDDLKKFKPEYLIGFPSSLYEIAKFGLRKSVDFPDGVMGIFTNAETITDEMRCSIHAFFKSKLYDQYSSSEGAPFIFQCNKGNYHMELQSGIFEVLDNNNRPAKDGQLVVTSFYTHGTPLIRYAIGDTVSISQNICDCGNANPLVSYIGGRESDWLFSEETGKINSANISNCVKGVHGIIKFQIIQNKLDELVLFIIADEEIYTQKDEKQFLKNIRDRVGGQLMINIKYCDDIPLENTGKFRVIKNNIGAILGK